MFKRREPLKLWHKAREFAWPSMGFKRMFNYLGLRIARLAGKDGGDKISKSIACGIAASFFPAVGIQAAIAALMAYGMRAPMVPAMLGTLLVPPFALPLIFVIDFIVGKKLLHTLGFDDLGTERHFEAETSDFDPIWFIDHLETLFLPAFVGFLIFLPFVWSASYMATQKVILLIQKRYQTKRHKP